MISDEATLQQQVPSALTNREVESSTGGRLIQPVLIEVLFFPKIGEPRP